MQDIAKSTRAEVLRIVLYQLIMIVGLTLILLFLKGMHEGLSILAGAIAYWLPTFIFMWRASAHAGARAATRFMIAFFAGEMIKLFLCGVLFVVVIKYFNAQLLYAVVGLIGAIVAFWIASMVVVFQKRVKV